MKIKGYKISEDGAQKFTANRGQVKGLLIYNPARASNSPELATEFNLADVKAWATYKAPGYSNPFLIARVEGVCVCVIKKDQEKEVQKLLRTVSITPWGGDEAEKKYEDWRNGDENALTLHWALTDKWKETMRAV